MPNIDPGSTLNLFADFDFVATILYIERKNI